MQSLLPFRLWLILFVPGGTIMQATLLWETFSEETAWRYESVRLFVGWEIFENEGTTLFSFEFLDVLLAHLTE